MSTFTLWPYERAAQQKGPTLAFGELVGRHYNPDPFGEVLYVCLLIPYGRDKTLMEHMMNDPPEIEKRQVGNVRVSKCHRRCVFAQITKERDCIGTASQLDALLT